MNNFHRFIRIVPEWNVKSRVMRDQIGRYIIRIVPEWTVKKRSKGTKWNITMIRIVPEWNVKIKIQGLSGLASILESYQSGM